MSSATWSLRERPVCSLAPAGTRRVRAASMFMCTSSSSGCHVNLPALICFPMASSPWMIARSSRWVRSPACRSIVAWAIDPAMSCRQSRRSNEMDSVNSATAAAGPPAKRPLRDTGVVCFMRCARLECAPKRRGSHCQKQSSAQTSRLPEPMSPQPQCTRDALPKKALSPVVLCEIVGADAMSEFKFACPVCGQHITADSSTSGGQIECPTCFQKIVVPQAPESGNNKFILSAAQVAKPRPTSAAAASQLGPLGTFCPPDLAPGGRWAARVALRGRRRGVLLPGPDIQIVSRPGLARHQRPGVTASRSGAAQHHTSCAHKHRLDAGADECGLSGHARRGEDSRQRFRLRQGRPAWGGCCCLARAPRRPTTWDSALTSSRARARN